VLDFKRGLQSGVAEVVRVRGRGRRDDRNGRVQEARHRCGRVRLGGHAVTHGVPVSLRGLGAATRS
jgi:hypothetical protein